MMAVLSRDAIKKAQDWKLEKAEVPEWGGDVYLKTLSGTERDLFEDGYADQKMKNFRARFLSLSLCDENGERLYGDDEASELGMKSSVVLNRLFDKAWALNAFRTEDVDALGNDSPSVPSDDSTSS
jgi:hypothetical protein